VAVVRCDLVPPATMQHTPAYVSIISQQFGSSAYRPVRRNRSLPAPKGTHDRRPAARTCLHSGGRCPVPYRGLGATARSWRRLPTTACVCRRGIPASRSGAESERSDPAATPVAEQWAGMQLKIGAPWSWPRVARLTAMSRPVMRYVKNG
jgi:hypothetical protein